MPEQFEVRVAPVPDGIRAATRAAAWVAVAVLLSGGASACGGDGGRAESGPRGSADRGGPGRGTGLHGAVLPEGRPKHDFTLTATDGEPYRFREETDGEVTLLFFGYTHCPNACPVQMATLGGAYGRLPWELQERIEVVFVTTDPARDTLSRLRSWLDNFDDSFVGLRGSRKQVNRIMESYGLPPARIDSTSGGSGSPGDGYTVGHAAHVLVFTPDGRLRMMYPTGTRQEAWADDLERLAREGADALAGAGDPGPPPGGG